MSLEIAVSLERLKQFFDLVTLQLAKNKEKGESYLHEPMLKKTLEELGEAMTAIGTLDDDPSAAQRYFVEGEIFDAAATLFMLWDKIKRGYVL